MPNILVDFALACLWGRGFGGINLGVCVVSCKFGKDLVEGNLMGKAWRGDTQKKVMLFLLYFPPFPRIKKKKL